MTMTTDIPEQTNMETNIETPVDQDWRGTISDPDLHKLAGRYESVSAMAKAVADLRRETSVRIKPLGVNPSSEEIASFRKQTGVPESAEEYGFDLPEGMEPTEADIAFRQEMAQAMHGSNVTAGQAAALGTTFNAILERQRSDTAEAATAAIEANVSELQREYGAEYDRNIELARRAARSFGSEGFVDFLESKTVDGVALGDHPDFVRAFARIGRSTGEPVIDIDHSSGERSTLEERIRDKRSEIQHALDRGDHRQARELDREERALWQRMGG